MSAGCRAALRQRRLMKSRAAQAHKMLRVCCMQRICEPSTASCNPQLLWMMSWGCAAMPWCSYLAAPHWMHCRPMRRQCAWRAWRHLGHGCTPLPSMLWCRGGPATIQLCTTSRIVRSNTKRTTVRRRRQCRLRMPGQHSRADLLALPCAHGKRACSLRHALA